MHQWPHNYHENLIKEKKANDLLHQVIKKMENCVVYLSLINCKF